MVRAKRRSSRERTNTRLLLQPTSWPRYFRFLVFIVDNLIPRVTVTFRKREARDKSSTSTWNLRFSCDLLSENTRSTVSALSRYLELHLSIDLLYCITRFCVSLLDAQSSIYINSFVTSRSRRTTCTYVPSIINWYRRYCDRERTGYRGIIYRSPRVNGLRVVKIAELWRRECKSAVQAGRFYRT